MRAWISAALLALATACSGSPIAGGTSDAGASGSGSGGSCAFVTSCGGSGGSSSGSSSGSGTGSSSGSGSGSSSGSSGGSSGGPSSSGSGSSGSSSGSGGCAAGQVVCPKGCADLESDPNNCGSCGYACPAGSSSKTPACVAGKCTYTCTHPSDTLCGNSCVDLSTGEPWADNGSTFNDCGQCGNICPVPPYGSCLMAACQSGTCGGVPDPSLDGSPCNTGGASAALCESGQCTSVKAYCRRDGTLVYVSPYSETPSNPCTCNGTDLETSNGGISCSSCIAVSENLDGSGFKATFACLQ